MGCLRLSILSQCFSLLNCWYHLPNQWCSFEFSFLPLCFSLSLCFSTCIYPIYFPFILICSYSFIHFRFSLKKISIKSRSKVKKSPRTSECVLCVLYTPLYRFFFFYCWYCWYCCLVSLLLLMLLNSNFLFELYFKFGFWLFSIFYSRKNKKTYPANQKKCFVL